ncbi:rhamnogalacturonan endolyase family protein [Nonomuraea sp. 10N515B]|uniref:rhamnogalacturonan endolyase family protein n=1 Tax=Nonomuraea sp. 10N515B TaxID=3457422 RepID=UPI003FCCC7CB
MERLDRGLVATTTPGGVFPSWRFLGAEVTGAGPIGMFGANFRVYRDGRPIATVTDSTNYLDPAGTPTSQHSVTPIGGHRSAPTSALRESFYDVPLRKPADGVTPAAEAYLASDLDWAKVPVPKIR